MYRCRPYVRAMASTAARTREPRQRQNKVSGFKKFLLRGNLVDLAVAFVIGAAFAALVTSLVKDFITPLLGLIGGKGDLGTRHFTIDKTAFAYGDFINAVIAFVIMA